MLGRQNGSKVALKCIKNKNLVFNDILSWKQRLFCERKKKQKQKQNVSRTTNWGHHNWCCTILKDLVSYLKGDADNLDIMARRAAASIISQWTPTETYNKADVSPAIYIALLQRDYLVYQHIYDINKDFAKAFILNFAVYIGRDKTPPLRKTHHWNLLTEKTDFDAFCTQQRNSNGTLVWFYFSVKQFKNYYKAFAPIGIDVISMFNCNVMNDASESITNYISDGFHESHKYPVMAWVLSQNFEIF